MKRIFLLITAAAVVCLSVAAQNQKVMNGKNTLVAYFSATGTTERVAEMIAETTGGDLYEITSVQEYTATDLDWTDKTSRRNLHRLPYLVEPCTEGSEHIPGHLRLLRKDGDTIRYIRRQRHRQLGCPTQERIPFPELAERQAAQRCLQEQHRGLAPLKPQQYHRPIMKPWCNTR